MFDATYVINLDRSPARWASAQRATTLAGLPNVIRMPAVDGLQLNTDTLAALQHEGTLARDLSAFDDGFRHAEIACGLSHARVLKEIMERGWRSALVLEDDIALTGAVADWPARFRAAYADLPAHWELWYLHRCFDVRHRVQRISRRTVIPWTPESGAAYAVTARGAEILHAAITPLSRAVDLVYKDVVKTRHIVSFAASPMLLDPALGSQRSQIRADAPATQWLQNGVNRPPEYRPVRDLAYLGEPPPFTAFLAEWWSRRSATVRRLWQRSGAME